MTNTEKLYGWKKEENWWLFILLEHKTTWEFTIEMVPPDRKNPHALNHGNQASAIWLVIIRIPDYPANRQLDPDWRQFQLQSYQLEVR